MWNSLDSNWEIWAYNMLEIGEIEKEEKLHVNDMEYESNEGEDDMVDFGRTLTAGCCVKSWFK